MYVDADRFVDAYLGKTLDYETLVDVLLEVAEQVGYKARVEEQYSARTSLEQRRRYLFTDVSLIGATLKKRAVQMPLLLRIYGRDPQDRIGVYFDEPTLYYRFFPLRHMGRSLERYAKALLGIIDQLPGAEPPEKLGTPEPHPPSDEPPPLTTEAQLPPSPPPEPLDAVGVRVPNVPKKPVIPGKVCVKIGEN